MADEAERGYDVIEILRRRRGGRPPIGSAASTVESVRLDPELKRDLLLRAAEEHITVSEATAAPSANIYELTERFPPTGSGDRAPRGSMLQLCSADGRRCGKSRVAKGRPWSWSNTVRNVPALHAIEVANFRSLAKARVQLGPLNVLVGPNGGGKSNLLDAIRFLGDSVRSDLGPALEVRGGFENVLFRGAKSHAITIQMEAQVTEHSSARALDVYSLTFRLQRMRRRSTGIQRSFLTRDESFRFKRTPRQGRRITINEGQIEVVDDRARQEPATSRKELLRSDSLGLATLPRLAEEEGGRQVNQIAELFATFRVVEIDVVAARGPATLQSGHILESDGSNLSAFLYRLSQNDPERFAMLQEDARAFIPGLLEIHFDPVGGGDEYVVLSIEEAWLPGRTKLADLSYGSVRALALLALLYDQNPPALTCMEEIDHGLHPHLFDRLVDRLREASEHTQFLLATHSPALVGRLRTDELIVCERSPTSGATVVPAITRGDMDRMVAAAEDRLDLGEMWFSGVLGGVPE